MTAPGCPLFPGFIAGASLKQRRGPGVCRGDLDLFPGFIAGASLKRHDPAGRVLQHGQLFPGFIAGASLKPENVRLAHQAPPSYSPALLLGPH